MIEEVGAIVHYLPPYSPDLNPIEETFSKVNAEIRNLEQSSMVDVLNIETEVWTGLDKGLAVTLNWQVGDLAIVCSLVACS